MVLDQNKWSLQVAWQKICHDHDAFLCAYQSATMLDCSTLMCTRWRAPPEGYMKLNSDGSFHELENIMGGGGLIRDSAGNWIRDFLCTGLGGDPFLAEATTLHKRLIMAWNSGLRNVLCEVDSADLVRFLSNSSSCRFHVHGLLLHEIRDLLNRGWRTRLAWISKEQNKAADCLAKHASSFHSLEV